MKFLTIIVCLFSLSVFSYEKITHLEEIINDEKKEEVTKLESLEFDDGSWKYIKTVINYKGELISVDLSNTPYQK